MTTFSLQAQVSQQLGLSFSGQRIWEIRPSDLIVQDHDFSISPNLLYQLGLNDERLLLRAEFGWIRRFSDSEKYIESTGYTEFRNDVSHLIAMNLAFGGSLFKTRSSALQLLGGVIISKDYYSTLYFKSVKESSAVIIDRANVGIRPLKVDLVASLSYTSQIFRSGNLASKSRLSLLLGLDLIYITERSKVEVGLDNPHPSFAAGFKVGLLYKFNTSKRGLR
ncbi:MAG: hypothetical protein NXI09_03640 [Bacteroidetes bacterium]|nr:hypothetical protein [Bacteroidota bacterium]